MLHRFWSGILFAAIASTAIAIVPAIAEDAPSPSISQGHPVEWLFVYKLNGKVYPGCPSGAQVLCPFGGKPQPYVDKNGKPGPQGQQYVFASNDDQELKRGPSCLGDSTDDPVGATFDRIYNGDLHYVVWNDQTYGEPPIQDAACKAKYCLGPWGHSKGVLAWDDQGAGVVMQVTTPDWPGSGSAKVDRKAGNTLGCVSTDNDIAVAQHFFSLRLSRGDVLAVVNALHNASVVTLPNDPMLVDPRIAEGGGPRDIAAAVAKLGRVSDAMAVQKATLSSGVVLISKPSAVGAPPWQLVSAELGGVSLRVASWYGTDKIPDTRAGDMPGCWPVGLRSPGAVTNATIGHIEDDKPFSVVEGPNGSHAKIAYSVADGSDYAIFGDMNQAGRLSGSDRDCHLSQNGRGGLFFVLRDAKMRDQLMSLLSAPRE